MHKPTTPTWQSAACIILEIAATIIAERFKRGDAYSDTQSTKDYLSYKLSGKDREVFGVMFLDNKHQLIDFKELFLGTVNSATVYPREIVKIALELNAAAVVLAHNHPFGDNTPSNADKQITARITDALSLVDIRVLDHIIIGKSALSFAESGLL